MTPKQHAALVFVSGELEAGRPSPSLEEIAAAVGVTAKSAAKRLVDKLVKTGRLTRSPDFQRNLRLPAPREMCCPSCGHHFTMEAGQ